MLNIERVMDFYDTNYEFCLAPISNPEAFHKWIEKKIGVTKGVLGGFEYVLKGLAETGVDEYQKKMREYEELVKNYKRKPYQLEEFLRREIILSDQNRHDLMATTNKLYPENITLAGYILDNIEELQSAARSWYQKNPDYKNIYPNRIFLNKILERAKKQQDQGGVYITTKMLEKILSLDQEMLEPRIYSERINEIVNEPQEKTKPLADIADVSAAMEKKKEKSPYDDLPILRAREDKIVARDKSPYTEIPKVKKDAEKQEHTVLKEGKREVVEGEREYVTREVGKGEGEYATREAAKGEQEYVTREIGKGEREYITREVRKEEQQYIRPTESVREVDEKNIRSEATKVTPQIHPRYNYAKAILFPTLEDAYKKLSYQRSMVASGILSNFLLTVKSLDNAKSDYGSKMKAELIKATEDILKHRKEISNENLATIFKTLNFNIVSLHIIEEKEKPPFHQRYVKQEGDADIDITRYSAMRDLILQRLNGSFDKISSLENRLKLFVLIEHIKAIPSNQLDAEAMSKVKDEMKELQKGIGSIVKFLGSDNELKNAVNFCIKSIENVEETEKERFGEK